MVDLSGLHKIKDFFNRKANAVQREELVREVSQNMLVLLVGGDVFGHTLQNPDPCAFFILLMYPNIICSRRTRRASRCR